MGHIYREDFLIPFDMADVNHNIKLPKLLSYCLFVSGKQSQELGRSDDYILENFGLLWIITDYEVTIHRLPRFTETITIETESISYNKFFCYRTFKIYDQNGELLLDVLTYFALMDAKTRKVSPVLPEIVDVYASSFVKKIQRAPKMLPLENAEQRLYHVRYFDIDMNGHVNNSIYLDWMYDVLGYEFLSSHRPAKLQLKYNREVSPGGDISSHFVRDGLTTYHDISSEGHINAQAVIEWLPLEVKE